MALAIVIQGSDPPCVLALVRDDLPTGWAAPAGCIAVPVSQLPSGWRMDAPPTLPVPESVTPWQLFTWLWRRRGITQAQVAGLLATLPQAQREQAEIDIQNALAFRRSHPLVETFGAALGMTAAEIDDAFREAAELA